ncbi:cell division protein MraZ [Alloiococcus otitis]|uniref:Transcriptional regulator MraZ n=1 Tax=Alloiococcus otitis ATCC 51267 TaxID=883081 RepID=K9ETX4_9LACT|nr:division/cell wall cluster transcriptional repressor MraZ [Alloiococcus otitis]EKU94377.1 protein MraZ [Alloiococcus otitis ATCC 51267]SUU81293.1 cell division protein MraZ [Alloiococcus otitis]
MLMGEFQHNIDAKGRLIVPSKFRESLGESFIVTRGLDGCLFGYPQEAWSELEEKLKQLPLAKKESRQFTRFFYSGAVECSLDKQGRINLPKTLIDYAKLEKSCYLIGVSERIEIWSEDRWKEVSASAGASFEELAEDMIDFGF